MSRLVLLSCFLAILVGCGPKHQVPGALQRFNGMRGQLGSVTADASMLSRDVVTLQHRMLAPNEPATRRAAVALKTHAMRFSRVAGRSANQIRALDHSEKSRPVRVYFGLLVSALSWQWREGVALRHTAELVWWDPLLTAPQDVRRLHRLSGAAQWDAWRAVLISRQAWRWQQRYRQTFRYFPVTPPAVAAGS